MGNSRRPWGLSNSQTGGITGIRDVITDLHTPEQKWGGQENHQLVYRIGRPHLIPLLREGQLLKKDVDEDIVNGTGKKAARGAAFLLPF